MEEIIVFTDGSCVGNGSRRAKAGIGLCFPNHHEIFPDIAERFDNAPITNQRAELWAIYRALQLITTQHASSAPHTITIYTDSLYSIKCLTVWIKKWHLNGWKSTSKQDVKNRDIIQPIHELIQQITTNASSNSLVHFRHVRSHTNAATFEALHNARADKLACSMTK